MDLHVSSGEPCRLVIVSHTLSEAQEHYQEARELRASATSGQYFYKDATPRAEHYLMCTVELVGHPHRLAVPLKLSLCFDDGSLVPYEDQSCLRLLKENVHVRPSISAETQMASFTYRIEIGSFRRADRSFVVRVDAEPTMGTWPEPAPIRIESCLTPPIYVLSKKRLTTSSPNGIVTAPSSPASDARMAADRLSKAKRKREEGDEDAEDMLQRMLLEKMDSLEQRVVELTTVVLTTIAKNSAAPHQQPHQLQQPHSLQLQQLQQLQQQQHSPRTPQHQQSTSSPQHSPHQYSPPPQQQHSPQQQQSTPQQQQQHSPDQKQQRATPTSPASNEE